MKQQKGITLIALIITIIVMLILVVVTINLAVGEDGIIKNARTVAKDSEEEAILEEIISMAKLNNEGRIDVEETVSKVDGRYEISGDPDELSVKGKTGTYKYNITPTGIKKWEDVKNFSELERGDKVQISLRMNPTISSDLSSDFDDFTQSTILGLTEDNVFIDLMEPVSGFIDRNYVQIGTGTTYAYFYVNDEDVNILGTSYDSGWYYADIPADPTALPTITPVESTPNSINGTIDYLEHVGEYSGLIDALFEFKVID